MTREVYQQLRTELVRRADDGYREFIMRGIPSERPFIGVRIPQVREIVAKIPREDFKEVLAEKPVAFEEVVARGFLIARLPYAEAMTHFDSQVETIDDWCNCDTFVAALRPVIRRHLTEFFDEKIEPLLRSTDEFAVRVGLVALLDFYVKPDYLAVIFDRIEKLAEREEYYVRMATAWLVAECFIKFPEPTLAYLTVSHLPKWTFNRAISKICDSRRVDDEMKAMLRKMRR